jgi:hypothetical protein
MGTDFGYKLAERDIANAEKGARAVRLFLPRSKVHLSGFPQLVRPEIKCKVCVCVCVCAHVCAHAHAGARMCACVWCGVVWCLCTPSSICVRHSFCRHRENWGTGRLQFIFLDAPRFTIDGPGVMGSGRPIVDRLAIQSGDHMMLHYLRISQ